MFEVHGVYANRKGTYTVLTVNPPKMKVRYDDGTEAELNIRVQRRIWENIEAERETADAKEATRQARRLTNTRYYIKAVSFPAADEMMFPGWQERIIMAADAANKLKPGDRIIYYALEAHAFFAVSTITGESFTADPKEYFYTTDGESAEFFPVDVDTAAPSMDYSLSVDAMELESYPHLRQIKIEPESFLEISEDDFELLSETLAEVSEESIEEEDDNYEEEDE